MNHIFFQDAEKEEKRLIAPQNVATNHRICLIIFAEKDPEFLKFLKEDSSKSIIEDALAQQKIDYEKLNDKKEVPLFTIEQMDLLTIYLLGQWIYFEPKLHAALSYFWTLFTNSDRSAEKLEGTKIKHYEYAQWNSIHYIYRNPLELQKKIRNSKSERSYGVTVHIPNGDPHQIYDIITVCISRDIMNRFSDEIRFVSKRISSRNGFRLETDFVS